MRFYTGRRFLKKYQGAIFIARHGPWNRAQKYAADVVVAWPDGKGGIREDGAPSSPAWSRTTSTSPPGRLCAGAEGRLALLVSDDHNGAITASATPAIDDAMARDALLLLPALTPIEAAEPVARCFASECSSCYGADGVSTDAAGAFARRAAELLCDHATVPVPPGGARTRSHDRGC